MKDIQDALADTQAGWDAHHEIADRAVLLRSHATRGHTERAEEIASEIDTLQRAQSLRSGEAWDADRTDGIVWQIDYLTFANATVHGYKRSRYFVTPFGTSIEDAQRHARRNFKAPGAVVTRVDHTWGMAA